MELGILMIEYGRPKPARAQGGILPQFSPATESPHPMPRLSLDEVTQIALLARLSLDDHEKQSLTEDLNVILEQFEKLQELDTSGVPPTTHAMSLQNVFRDDVARPSLPREAFVHEAPQGRDEFFVVPRVVEG